MIPSSDFFDVGLVDPALVLVGNHLGVDAPVRFETVDANGDGRSDLRFFFETQAVQVLREEEIPPAVALRYLTYGGTAYLVPDIFALGSPVGAVTGISALGRGDVAVMPAQPNPFTATTEVRYSVASGQGGLVDLGVYDVSGRRVRTLSAARATREATWPCGTGAATTARPPRPACTS